MVLESTGGGEGDLNDTGRPGWSFSPIRANLNRFGCGFGRVLVRWGFTPAPGGC